MKFDLSTLGLPINNKYEIYIIAKNSSGFINSSKSKTVSYLSEASYKRRYLSTTKIVPSGYSNACIASELSDMNTSKIYTLQCSYVTSYVNYCSVFYITYKNGKWESTKASISSDNILEFHILAQTNSNIICCASLGGFSTSGGDYFTYLLLESDIEADTLTLKKYTYGSDKNLAIVWMCFAENTLITTDNGDKPVQDITYDDNILVWNFDEGRLDYEKPVWIKQEQIADSYWNVINKDGKTINLVGQNGKSHRFYNKLSHSFDYPQDISDCKCTEIHKSVKYYNLITSYHFNCFANGILTSNRFSNMLYPITSDMKYDKTNKHINNCKRNQFNFLTDDEFKKLRLGEMEYSEELKNYVLEKWSIQKN